MPPLSQGGHINALHAVTTDSRSVPSWPAFSAEARGQPIDKHGKRGLVASLRSLRLARSAEKKPGRTARPGRACISTLTRVSGLELTVTTMRQRSPDARREPLCLAGTAASWWCSDGFSNPVPICWNCVVLAARLRTDTNADAGRAELRSARRLKIGARATQVAGRQPQGERACPPCLLLAETTASGTSPGRLGILPLQGSRRYFCFML